MRSLTRPEPPLSRERPAFRDPAPSRVAYRWQRLVLTPLFRKTVRLGLPAFCLTFGAGLFLSDEANRTAITETYGEVRRQVEERPEFRVTLMSVEGASPELFDRIRALLPLDFPVSSFDLDLPLIQERVQALDAVSGARVMVRSGILQIDVDERTPAILWRTPEALFVLDAEGVRVATLARRADRADLPLLAGEGADEAVSGALDLLDVAEPLRPRIRGLVRMGERRWDLVLDRDQRILLPETGAVAALERVMALDEAQDLLARDVALVDMRIAARPVVRLRPAAVERLRQIRSIQSGDERG